MAVAALEVRPAFRTEWYRHLREAVWAVAAGAWVGLVVGGIGGRLAMLLLRFTSPGYVIGVTSDDGFEIGRVSLQTLNLLLAGMFFGALAGVAYWLFRIVVVARNARYATWWVFSTLLGGAALVQDGGVDFGLLEPLWLAVGLFILIPSLAGVTIALVAEDWIASPAPGRGATFVRCLPGLAAFIIPITPLIALLGSVAWTAIQRLPPAIGVAARMVGAAMICGIAVLSAMDLVSDLETLVAM